MNEPLVSVVMSVFNEPEDYLRESIESILKQTYSNFEFIIIIDSPENKKGNEVVTSYAIKDKRIKIILNKENEGLASSLNKGLAIAKGEYIARMDADDISFPQRLQNQLLFMEENPDISLIGSSIIYIDDKNNISESKLVKSDYIYLKRYILLGGTPCHHPTWFFRKELLVKIKGYRDLPASQDYDFLMRVFYLNFRVSNIEEPLLYHRLHFNKIGARKNIYQIKLTRYIVKAVKEGFILDDKRFTPALIRGLLKTPSLLYLLHNLSLRFFILSYTKKTYRKPMALLFYMLSIIISPYRLYRAFWNTRRTVFLMCHSLLR